VVYQDENFWMSQRGLADLFGVKRPAITEHPGNIFDTGELEEKEVEPNSVVRNFRTTAADRKSYYHSLTAT